MSPLGGSFPRQEQPLLLPSSCQSLVPNQTAAIPSASLKGRRCETQLLAERPPPHTHRVPGAREEEASSVL